MDGGRAGLRLGLLAATRAEGQAGEHLRHRLLRPAEVSEGPLEGTLWGRGWRRLIDTAARR